MRHAVYLVLVLLTLAWALDRRSVQGHELHVIRMEKGSAWGKEKPIEEKIPMSELPHVLSTIYNVPLSVSHWNERLKGLLLGINDLWTSPYRVYWTLIIPGFTSLEHSTLSFGYKSSLTLSLVPDHPGPVDVNTMLTFPSAPKLFPGRDRNDRNATLHLSNWITTFGLNDTLFFAEAYDPILLLSMAPHSHNYCELNGAFYASSESIIVDLRSKSALPSVDAGQLFGVKSEDLTRLVSLRHGKGLVEESKEIIMSLRYLASLSPSLLRRATYKTPSLDFYYYGIVHLQRIAKSFGTHSPEYRLALSFVLDHALPKIMAEFDGLFGTNSLGLLLLLDETVDTSTSLTDRVSSLLAQDLSPPGGSIPFCYESENQCKANTDTCSGKGVCMPHPARFQDNITCFYCACTEGASGYACQFEDWSEAFLITLIPTLLLFLLLIWTLIRLVQLGQERPSTYLNPPSSSAQASHFKAD